MNKEEAIKEAYGADVWNILDDSVKKNILSNSGGWTYEINEKWLEHSKGVEIELKDKYCRPKSLQGIENNNGWIKIESKEDFPKNSTYIETILNCYEINDPKAQGMHHFILGDETFLLERISHYRVIPFNPPIY